MVKQFVGSIGQRAADLAVRRSDVVPMHLLRNDPAAI